VPAASEVNPEAHAQGYFAECTPMAVRYPRTGDYLATAPAHVIGIIKAG
jgi:hypothetical protein